MTQRADHREQMNHPWLKFSVAFLADDDELAIYPLAGNFRDTYHEPPIGFEPMTFPLQGACSSPELRWQNGGQRQDAQCRREPAVGGDLWFLRDGLVPVFPLADGSLSPSRHPPRAPART